jgi:hypothetical protein
MKNGTQKISKREWYARGGFSNPDLFRRMRGGSWSYYMGAKK